MGNPAKPTHLKIVNGSAARNPGRINPQEPKLKRGWPRPPKELTKEAMVFWREFCQVIDDHRILTPQHARPIAEMCELYALIISLRKEVEDGGRVVIEQNVRGDDKVKINPALPQLLAAQRAYYLMLGQFGLTPSAVTKVSGLDNGNEKEGEKGFFD